MALRRVLRGGGLSSLLSTSARCLGPAPGAALGPQGSAAAFAAFAPFASLAARGAARGATGSSTSAGSFAAVARRAFSSGGSAAPSAGATTARASPRLPPALRDPPPATFLAAARHYGRLFSQLSKSRLSALVASTAVAGYVLGSGEAIDYPGLVWTTLGTFATAASANAFNQVGAGGRGGLSLRAGLTCMWKGKGAPPPPFPFPAFSC